MSNVSIRQIPSVQRYANALFQLSREAKVVDSVSKDLQNLKDIIISRKLKLCIAPRHLNRINVISKILENM